MINAPFSVSAAIDLHIEEAIQEYNEYLDPYYELPTNTVVALDPSAFHVVKNAQKRDKGYTSTAEVLFHEAFQANDEIGMLEAIGMLDNTDDPAMESCEVIYDTWVFMQSIAVVA